MIHHGGCPLALDPFDQACFTANELMEGCDCGDLAQTEIAHCRELLAEAYKKLSGCEHHASDCATSNAPAMTPGPCDCTLPPLGDR